jgi:hypothetical protein
MNCCKALSMAVVLAAVALPAMADCTAPTAPTRVPDGKTASEREMLAAMGMMKQYDTDVGAYVKCLEFETRLSRLSSTEGNRRQSEAVSALTATAARFNEQVRVFKAKAG